MSRSGYSDDYDDLALGRWRGQVVSSIRGKRGQAFLRDLADALEGMAEKRLIPNHLRHAGEVCALGALGARRGINLEALDPEDYDGVARAFGIASPLAQEIVYMNDEHLDEVSPETRWTRMHGWVKGLLQPKGGAA